MKNRMECVRCGEDIVHPDRKYCLCLDCFMDLIMEHTDMDLPIRFKKEHYDQCSACGGIEKKGTLYQADCWKKCEPQLMFHEICMKEMYPPREEE